MSRNHFSTSESPAHPAAPIAWMDAKQVRGGHAAALEDQLRRLGSAQAHLPLDLPHPESRRSLLHHEGAVRFAAAASIGGGKDDHPLRARSIGDEALGSIQHPVTSVL